MDKKEGKEEKKVENTLYDEPTNPYYRGKPKIIRTIQLDVDERIENSISYIRNMHGLWDDQDVIRHAIAETFSHMHNTVIDRDYRVEQTRKLGMDNELKRRQLWNDDGSRKV